MVILVCIAIAYVLFVSLFLCLFHRGQSGGRKSVPFLPAGAIILVCIAMALVVYHDGSLCGECVFSLHGDCLKVAQLILTVGHTRDRPGRSPPVCCRHKEKHLELLSLTLNSRNSSKNRVPHTRCRSEAAPSALSYHVGKSSKMTTPTSPDSAYRPVRNAVEAYIV